MEERGRKINIFSAFESTFKVRTDKFFKGKNSNEALVHFLANYNEE